MLNCKKPLLTVIMLYVLCFVFRILEYFVLRTDQTFWGEAFVHKLIGIVILFVAARILDLRPKNIGFSKEKVVVNLGKGLAFGISIFVIAYGVEVLLAVSEGGFRSLQLYVSSYAVDGNVGNQTSLIFFLLCIAGNIINVVMEEGVFRGLFQKIIQSRFSFVIAAVIASCLFGLWHVMGPIRNYYDGMSSMGGMIANMIMLVVTSGLVGFKFAMLTRITGSLYMAMGDHFVNNTIVNILHVVSETGADELMFVRISIAQSLSFLIVLIYYLKVRHKLTERNVVA